MSNVVEILIQAKGGEQLDQQMSKADTIIAGLKGQFVDLRSRMDALVPSVRAVGSELDKLPKPRHIPLDSSDIEKMKARVKELEAALEPSRIQSRIRAMERELQGLGKGTSLGLGDLDVTSLSGFASSIGRVAGAAAVGIGAVTAFGAAERAVLAAAAESELAQVKFAQAIAVTGQYSSANVARMQEFAGGIQRVTTQTDEAVLSAAALIAQIGGLSGGTLERATTAAVNLSAVLGTDLQSSALMVARAATGATQGMERLVGQIKEGATPAETFANVLARLEALGQPAAAQADTLTGALIQMKNTVGEVAEAFGRIQIGPFTALLNGATAAVQKYLDVVGQIGQARSLTVEIDQLDKFLVRFADNARKAGEALDVFRNSDAAKNLNLLVEHGKVDEARAALLLLQAELDRIRSRPATPVTVDVAHSLQQQIDALKLRFKARLELDDAQARKDLDAFGVQFKPKDMVAKVTVNTQAVREAVAALDAAGVTIRPSIDLDAVRQQIAGAKPGLRDLATIQADMRISIPRASIEELAAQKAQLEARLASTTAAVLKSPQDQTARRQLEEAIALVQQFNALSPARVTFLVDEKIVGQLESIRRTVDETLRAASGNSLSIVSEADLARSRTLAEEMNRDRTALQALLDAGKGAQASTALNGMLAALAELGRQLPERRSQVEAFAASLRQEFAARIKVQVDQADAQARLRNTKAILEDLSKVAPNKIEAFDTSQLVRSAQSAQEAMRAFDVTMRHALTGTDPGQLVAVLTAVDAAIGRIEASADPVDASVIAYLATVRAEARLAAGALQDVSKAADIRKRIDIAIGNKDIAAAKAALETLKRLAAQFPTNIDLQVQVEGAERAVANLDTTAKAARRAAEQMRQSIAGSLAGGLANLVTVPFAAALGETRSFAEQMKTIIGQLVKDIIAEMAKLAILRFVFKIASGGLLSTAEDTTKATAPIPGPSTSKTTLPPSQPVSVPAPRILAPRLQPIAIAAPDFVVAPIPAINIGAPEVRVPDLEAVQIPQPEVIAPGPTAIAVTLEAGPLAPVRVEPPRVALTSGLPEIRVPTPRVAALRPLLLAAPAVSVRQPDPVVVAPGVVPLEPAALRQEVRIRPLDRAVLAPPEMAVAAPGRLQIPAPTFAVGATPRIELPTPAVDLAAPEIAVPEPIVRVGPGSRAPLVVPAPPVVVGTPPRPPRVQAPRFEVPVPGFAVRGKPQESFAFDAPEFQVSGRPLGSFEVPAPEFSMGPVGDIAPVRLDVPIVTATARAPRIAAPTIAVPRPNVILPRVQAPQLVVPRVPAAVIRVPGPILQTPPVQRLTIRAPVVDLPRVALPAVRVGTPTRASVSVPAPSVSVPPAVVSVRAPIVSVGRPIVSRETPPAIRAAALISSPASGAIAPPNVARLPGFSPPLVAAAGLTPALTRALGRLSAAPPISTVRPLSVSSTLEFARTAPRFQPARLPGFDGRPREQASERVSRFFGVGAAASRNFTMNMNVKALDAGSIEREARPGGSIYKATVALARARRE